MADELAVSLDDAHLVRRGARADVYHTIWRGREVTLRRYGHTSLIRSLYETFVGSRAQRAWAASHRLVALRIPTARPLACIDRRRGPLLWESWFVQEHLDRPTLAAVLGDASVSEGRRRRLLRQAVRLLDRVGSRKTQANGILCDKGRILLTDPDGVQFRRSGWLSHLMRRSDVAGLIPELAGTQNANRPNAEFIRVQRAGGVVWLNPDFPTRELEEALSGGSQALDERFQAQPIPSASTSRVRRITASFNDAPTNLYWKEYLDRSVWDPLKQTLRSSRAVRAMRASRMLGEHGFQAPQVVAAGNIKRRIADSRASSRRAGTSRCFMATCEVQGAMPIQKYLMPAPDEPAPCSLRERRDLLRQFGLTVGRMHRTGIVHGDLRPGNVLVRKKEDRWEFFLIDNERTRKHRYLRSRLRRKNLVQINMLPRGISNTDRMRFFLPYLLLNPSVRRNREGYARKIMAVTRRRLLSWINSSNSRK
ncbi:MAG: hypothetical protein KBE65_06610 [Phycisphaerae bacterium]|nr:hypothetical protein [Phycisphaerae bacterium]